MAPLWLKFAQITILSLASSSDCPGGFYVVKVHEPEQNETACVPCLCPYGDMPIGCGGDQPGLCETPDSYGSGNADNNAEDDSSSGFWIQPVLDAESHSAQLPTECLLKADIVLVLDKSGSVSAVKDDIAAFALDLIQQFHLGDEAAQVG
eukprot:2875448-Pleurochrysis_carterae.AAC.4